MNVVKAGWRRLSEALLLLMVGACASPRADLQYGTGNFPKPDTFQSQTAVAEGYQISPMDTLKIDVLDVPDYSGDYQVDAAGRIKMPLLGEVTAAGKSASELQAQLEKAYGAQYLQKPDVRVSIKDAVGQRITVDGAVTQPGVYPIAGTTSLMQSVALAHGLKDDALESRVVVFRQIKGQREAAGFNLKRIRAGLDPDPTLYGSDIVVVDGSSVRKNLRDALQSVPLLALFGPL